MQITFKVITAVGTNPTWIGARMLEEGGRWHMHSPRTRNKRHTLFVTCEYAARTRILRVLQSQAGIESVEKIIEIGSITDG